jgi:hypothetical protein
LVPAAHEGVHACTRTGFLAAALATVLFFTVVMFSVLNDIRQGISELLFLLIL